jgi:hypothetical protein
MTDKQIEIERETDRQIVMDASELDTEECIRERETERQTDRHTHTQTDIMRVVTKRETDRQIVIDAS